MPLNVPRLDDRTYADLVREGLELIPGSAPGWTNHDAPTRGSRCWSSSRISRRSTCIASIECRRRTRRSFSNCSLRSIVEPLTTGSCTAPSSRCACRRAPSARPTSSSWRCTRSRRWRRTRIGEEGGSARVSRVHCFGRRNFEAAPAAERQRDRPGHTTVVFVPDHPRLPETALTAIAQAIRNTLKPRRLLTSRVHIVSPRYIDIALRIRAAIAASRAPTIEAKIRQEVEEQYRSWPLGRHV